MRIFPRYSLLAVCTAAVIGSGIFFGLQEWPAPDRLIEFSGLILGAVLISSVARPAVAESSRSMPLSFVPEFAALLLFGVNPALFVVAASCLSTWLTGSDRRRPFRRLLLNAAIVMLAMQAAGLAYSALGGTRGSFEWPFQTLPIAAAVVAYLIVKAIASEVMVPLLNREAVNQRWSTAVLRGCPFYFIGASVAVAVVEVLNHRMWEIVPAAMVPLYCAYRAYSAGTYRVEEEQRRREVIESLNEGLSAVDNSGRVTLWSDALERMMSCPRERALGRPLVSAVPALAQTTLPRALKEALTTGRAQVTQLSFPSTAGARTLEIKLLPSAGGATLICHDVTATTQGEQTLKRNEERLALAAEGANDGLWEWDLRTQTFFASARWRGLLGLTAADSVGRPEEWFDRVHADDVGSLREALASHLSGAVERLQHEHRIRHEDGTYRRFLCRSIVGRGAGQRVVRIAGSISDTTDQSTAREQLRSAGFRDPLTGLSNRAVFVETLGRRLAQFKQERHGEGFAVLYLDLDRFKVVNDSLGHMVGDELLTAVSRRLESCLRQGDALARLGGDEFAILLNGLGDPQQANAVAFRMQKALSAPFSIGGREVFTSASIGIAFGLAHYSNPDEIMRDADTAMYHAKSRGKARHELFDADMHLRARDRLELENDLRRAIDNNSFEVHYQPIVRLESRMCVGFESLIRWTRNGESVSPAVFIPIAEELGLIEPLGTWVLQQACHTFAEWQRQFPAAAIDCITVNVSSRQLMQQHFMLIVEQAVEASGLEPRDLRLEITETALMDSPQVAAKVLTELREFGVKIYLDDFGTGYSSLSHLHKLPVDALKIDRSFVRSLVLSDDRPAIVESILALARTLNTSVVAEGIESDDQANELQRLGCTHAQGFLFSRPLSSQAAERLLQANQPLGPRRVPALGEARRRA
jgi:diguanylate cyclase (GGDEF)-like protein/PAS domain S-box-containing protein